MIVPCRRATTCTRTPGRSPLPPTRHCHRSPPLVAPSEGAPAGAVRSFSRKISTAPPVSFTPCSRAGITRLLLPTSRSPGPQVSSQMSENRRCASSPRCAVHHQQPRRIARLDRRLRDQFRRQIVVKVARLHVLTTRQDGYRSCVALLTWCSCSEQSRLLAGLRVRLAQVLVGPPGRHPAARRAVEEAELQQVRLDHIHDRVRLLAQRGRDRLQPHRPAAKVADDAAQHRPVQRVQPQVVDVQQRQRLLRGRPAVMIPSERTWA